MSTSQSAPAGAGVTAAEVAVPPVVKPMREMRGGHAGITWAGLEEVWQFRQVFSALVVREVKVRYKQTAIGVGWAFLQPIVAAAIFALFLGHISKVASEGAPYLLFALAGMVIWTYFSGTLGNAAQSLIVNQMLLRKIYFPREILPLYAVVAGIIDLLPGLLVLIVVAFLYGYEPTTAWLLLPIPVMLVIAATVGIGMALSAINVFYRDVRYALPFLLQLMLFASAVVFSLSAIPSPWRTPYAILNPIAESIDGVRQIVLHGNVPDLGVMGAAFAWTAVLAISAYWLFKRLEPSFSDRV